MKLNNWKEFIKNKTSVGFAITGIMAVAIVTAITLNQGKQTPEEPLVDLNEGKKTQESVDNRNDSLLEFDDYAGNYLPSESGKGQVDIAGSGALDLENSKDQTADVTDKKENQIADNSRQNTPQVADSEKKEDSKTENQTAKEESPDNTQVAENKKAESPTQVADKNENVEGQNQVQTAEGEKPIQVAENEDSTKEVSGITVESLEFQIEDGLAWPVHGNVILPYSADHAIYHATLMQFKVNPAILIGCEEGTQVLAPTRGIITEVTETPQTGVTVTMAIGSDYSLVYGQLEKGKWAVGDILEPGDTIGTVAKVSRYYSVEGNNLYFQIRHGEETIDPLTLLRTE